MRLDTLNIKWVLGVLVAVPLLFVACAPEQESPKAPILGLSTQEVTLSCEGGEVVIPYTLENAVEGVAVVAECDAEWIGDVVVGEQEIVFHVAENRDAQREAQVTISYDTIVHEVLVVQGGFEGLNFEATILSGDFYHKDTLYWNAHNYYFTLSDAEINRENPVPNSTYFYFDLYSETMTEDASIPCGTYVLDPESKWLAGTLNGGKTYGFTINAMATDYSKRYLFTEGEVVVGERSIHAEFVCEDGSKVYVGYEGDLVLTPHYPEEKHVSTLESDVELNYSNVTISANYYGTYYTPDSDNWTVRIYEDSEHQNGLFMQLELLADPAADNWAACYNALQDNSLSNPEEYINTYIKGYLTEGQITGSWYAVLKNGVINYEMAPIMDGVVDVVFNADGTATFTFDCFDDAGNKIAGTVMGAMP